MRKEDKIQAEQKLLPLIDYQFNNNPWWSYDMLVYDNFLEVAYERKYRIPYKIAKSTNFQYKLYLIKKIIKKYMKKG